MIWREQQISRIGERFVVGKPIGVGVSMGANDWQRCHLCVESPGDAALIRVAAKQAIWMEDKWFQWVSVAPISLGSFYVYPASGSHPRDDKARRNLLS